MSAEAFAAARLAAGRRVAIALLVDAAGSSPFVPGAQMVLDDDGGIEGSVTGGCVEAAIAEEAAAIFSGGGPRLLSYGVSDGRAADVGLSCGGRVRIFLHRAGTGSAVPLAVAAAAREEMGSVAIATGLEGESAGAKLVLLPDQVVGGLGDADLDRAVVHAAEEMLAADSAGIRRCIGSAGVETDVFIHSHREPARMLVVGADDHAVALARAATELGYRVAVCDPRRPFLTDRVSAVADAVAAWPDAFLTDAAPGPRDAVLVLSHDPKLDEPALLVALSSEAGYVGALGSRRTQADRRRRLLSAGLEEERLGRLRGPCGLDLGGRTPEETAISILAEVIAVANDRGGAPLSFTAGAIHPLAARR